MGKRSTAILLALILTFFSAGCASLFKKDYYYSEDYGQQGGLPNGDALEIHNKSMLLGELLALVGRHEESCEFRFTNYNGSPSDDLASACFEVKNSNSLGAYAVDDISYDTSRIVSYYTAQVEISYKKTAEEIESIVSAAAGDVRELLREGMEDFADKLVIRVNTSAVDSEYLTSMARELYFEDPTLTVTEPVLNILAYPNEGNSRIFEISFDYGAYVPKLKNAVLSLRSAVAQTAAEINGDSEAALALAAAEHLGGAAASEPEGEFAATAYGAIVERSANPRGMALAYKSLCTELGIECFVVEGSLENVGGSYWNIIRIGDDCYHVDMSRFSESPQTAFLLSDDMMWGRYLWDNSVYPECSGVLRYRDLVPESEPEDGEPGADAPDEGDEPPAGQETPPPETEPEPSPSPSPEQGPEPVENTQEPENNS